MAQYDLPAATAPEQLPTPSRKWPLALVMAIDFVIALVAFVLVNLAVPLAFISFRAMQQGISPGQLSGTLQDASQVLRLVGADGLFVTLLATNAVFLLIPIVRVKYIRREPLSALGFRAGRLVRLVLIGIGVGVLSFILNAAISGLFRAAGIEPDQAAQYPLFQGDYVGQFLFLIGAAVLAPIGEETLFRGYMFNALRQTFAERSWGVPLAYVLSAALFAAVHSVTVSQGLIGVLVPIFVIGLLLAWAMHYTKSLIPGIIAHAINNGVALAALVTCINNPSLTGCPRL
jgi:membrane protease YdiL (CAAX protease family)